MLVARVRFVWLFRDDWNFCLAVGLHKFYEPEHGTFGEKG